MACSLFFMLLTPFDPNAANRTPTTYAGLMIAVLAVNATVKDHGWDTATIYRACDRPYAMSTSTSDHARYTILPFRPIWSYPVTLVGTIRLPVCTCHLTAHSDGSTHRRISRRLHPCSDDPSCACRYLPPI
jgi:hypothetical protein